MATIAVCIANEPRAPNGSPAFRGFFPHYQIICNANINKSVVCPVSSTFEKRLAELVWEHCPELASQTSAGNMALSLDCTSPDVQSTALTQLISEVRALDSGLFEICKATPLK